MTTYTLTLCPLSAAHQEGILDVVTDHIVKQTYMLPDFSQKEDAIPLFERLKALSLDPAHYVRCILVNGYPIGFLNDVEIHGDRIELGYAIASPYHGQGYMTKALQAAIAELFAMGYGNIVCGAFSENVASMRVMEKSGMQRIDFTEDIEYRGKTHHCIYYGIHKEVPNA